MVRWPLQPTDAPQGSLELEVEYREGNKSSKNHLPIIGPLLEAALGCAPGTIYRGSLNFHADRSVALPSPATVVLGGWEWTFVPVVILNSALGIAARRADSGDIPFIEVFACEKLQPILDLVPNTRITIRLLPGTLLKFTA